MSAAFFLDQALAKFLTNLLFIFAYQFCKPTLRKKRQERKQKKRLKT